MAVGLRLVLGHGVGLELGLELGLGLVLGLRLGLRLGPGRGLGRGLGLVLGLVLGLLGLRPGPGLGLEVFNRTIIGVVAPFIEDHNGRGNPLRDTNDTETGSSSTQGVFLGALVDTVFGRIDFAGKTGAVAIALNRLESTAHTLARNRGQTSILTPQSGTTLRKGTSGSM